MNIKYHLQYESKQKENSLSDIVKSRAHYDSGVAEAADSKASAAIEFTEKVVELLYSKGLLDKIDIENLVKHFVYCDEDIEIVK